MKNLVIIAVCLLTLLVTSCSKEVSNPQKKLVLESFQSVDFTINVSDTSEKFSFNITSIVKQSEGIFFETYFCDFGDGVIDSFKTNIGGDYHKYLNIGDYHVKFFFKTSSLVNGLMLGNSFVTTVPKTAVIAIDNNNFSYLSNLNSLYLANNKISNLQQLNLPSTIFRLVFTNNQLTQSSIDNLLYSASLASTATWGIVRTDFQRPSTSPSLNGLNYKQVLVSKGWIVNND